MTFTRSHLFLISDGDGGKSSYFFFLSLFFSLFKSTYFGVGDKHTTLHLYNNVREILEN